MNKLLLATAIVLAFPMGALSQYYNYAPSTTFIPSLTQKGDLNLGLGSGRGAEFESLETQVAYSVLPHIALMANYFDAREKSVRSFARQGTDAYSWDVGLGIYEPLPKGSASLFAGYGAGSLFSNFQEGTDDLNASLRFQRWFLQPSISYRSHFFHAAMALRLSHLAYKSGEISYSIDNYHLDFYRNIESSGPFFLPEIGAQAGLVVKYVSAMLCFTAIYPNTAKYNFSRANIALLLSANLNVRKKKRANTTE